MQNFQLGGLVSEASLMTTPQESLTNCEEDFTSIFGTFGNDYLKGITIMHSTENVNTPFTYDNMMHNVFGDDYEIPESAIDTSKDYDDDEEDFPTLGFEC